MRERSPWKKRKKEMNERFQVLESQRLAKGDVQITLYSEIPFQIERKENSNSNSNFQF